MSDKVALRRTMQALRAACPDRSGRDTLLLCNVLSSPLYREAENVLSYVSFGSEASTWGLLRQALADGKALFVPRCRAKENRMDFYRIDTVDALTPGMHGILEPPAIPEHLFTCGKKTLCILPGLAFSSRGDRLGYGKGYYDTFLQATPVYTVGFCYAFQVLDAIPTEPHDIPVSSICTDAGWYGEHADPLQEKGWLTTYE